MLYLGEFVFGLMLEFFILFDNFVGWLEGKFLLGWLGLLMYFIVGFIDFGFSGYIILELFNVVNLLIILWFGMKIG